MTLAPALARAEATAAGATLGNIASDPFTFYYAYYLPNQQIQAMRPTPSDTINQAVIDRQYYAQTQKQSLYNPISPYAEDYDPLRPYSRQQGTTHRPAVSLQQIPPTAMAQDLALLYPGRSVFHRSEIRPWAKCERRHHSPRPNGRRYGRWHGRRHGHAGHGRNGLIVSMSTVPITGTGAISEPSYRPRRWLENFPGASCPIGKER